MGDTDMTTPDEQKVERVAKAMADSDGYILENLPPHVAGTYRRRARADLAAMPYTKALEAADELADWFDLWLESGDTPEESDPNHLMAAMLALTAYRAARGGKA